MADAWRKAFQRLVRKGTLEEELDMSQAWHEFLVAMEQQGLDPSSLPAHAASRLRPFQLGGAADLKMLTLCLQRAANKAGQLSCIATLPENAQAAEECFALGYRVADRRLFLFGELQSWKEPKIDNLVSYAVTKAMVYRRIAAGRAPAALTMTAADQLFATLESQQASSEATRDSKKMPKAGTQQTLPLCEADRIVVARHALWFNGTGSLPALTEWAMRILRELGHLPFLALFERPRGADASLLVLAAQLTADLCTEEPAVFDLLHSLYEGTTLTLQSYTEQLRDLQADIMLRRFPEKPLDEVLAAFASVGSCDVEHRVSEADLVLMAKAYRQIHSLGPKLQTLDTGQLLSQAQPAAQLKEMFGQYPLAVVVARLAVLREQLRRHYRILPYNTQVLTVLGLLLHQSSLRGRLAQVKTGEGKSTCVALLAGFCALGGATVDIVSSAEPLACRDQAKYAAFFASVGVSCSHVCGEEPVDGAFRARVCYGTNFNFEFALLRDGLFNKGTLCGRTPDVVIVDEVDNLFIDRGNNSAIMSVPGLDPLAFVVQPILDFVQQRVEVLLGFTSGVGELRTVLQDLASTRSDGDAHLVRQLDEETLATWVSSCRTALQRQEGVHYVITGTPPEVVIVDLDTGQLMHSSRWSDRVHQFIEAKHGLKLRPESLTAAEISHPIFFGAYRCIFGLTGTIGSQAERDETRLTYRVDSFDVPAHLPNQRRVLKPVLVPDSEAHTAALTNEVVAMQAAGRPVLVLLPTIRESISFAGQLARAGIPHQVYNALQDEDEAYLIARAGRAGMCTVATNTAGRGTDIILTAPAREAGGLHVVLGFYPPNQRVEAQGVGRAARQGQAGSCRMVLMASNSSGTNVMEQLAAEREKQVRQLSRSRLITSRAAEVNHTHLARYFDRNQAWQKAAETHSLQDRAHALLHDAANRARADCAAFASQTDSMLDTLSTGSHHELVGHAQHMLHGLLGDASRSTGPLPVGFFDQFLRLAWMAVRAHVLQQWGEFFDSLKRVRRLHDQHANRECLDGDDGAGNLEAALDAWTEEYRAAVQRRWDEVRPSMAIFDSGISAQDVFLQQLKGIIAACFQKKRK